MEKFYTRINWRNDPSVETPINEGNLNHMDYALYELDGRVFTLYTEKANKDDTEEMFVNISFNQDTGIFTFTKKNGKTVMIDTLLEKVVTNFRYDSATQSLIITTPEGEQSISLSAFITEYEFEDTDTVAFSVVDGKVKAIVPEGSIEEKHLRPNYLADCLSAVDESRYLANYALEQAEFAHDAQVAAQSYAVGGTDTRDREETDNAKYYCQKAHEYAEEAKQTDVGHLQKEVEELQEETAGINKSFTQQKDAGFLQKNLFDIAKIVGGYYLNNAFVPQATSDYWGTVVVKIDGLKEITLSGFPNTVGVYTAYLNSENVADFATNAWGSGSNNGTHTLNTNYKYLGIAFRNTTDLQTQFPNKQAEKGTEATAYTPYAMSNTDLTQSVDELKKSFTSLSTAEAITNFVTSSIFSWSQITAYKLGKMVTVNINITVGATALSEFAQLISNLPKAKYTIFVTAFNRTNPSNPVALYMDAGGTIIQTIGNSMQANNRYIATFSYLSE